MKVISEDAHWVDRGCNVSASCLACPLRECKYVDPSAYHEEQRQQRGLEAAEAMGRLGDAWAVARELGISTRTVYRRIRRHREQGRV